VLGLCARAGLASVGVVAIDGTKMSANASMNANRDFGQIAREILEGAAEIDRREDELYGRERGDELPEHLRTREGRRKALREAKERLERERGQSPSRPTTTMATRSRSSLIRSSSSRARRVAALGCARGAARLMRSASARPARSRRSAPIVSLRRAGA
jgi:hypothetical protein